MLDYFKQANMKDKVVIVLERIKIIEQELAEMWQSIYQFKIYNDKSQ